MRGVLPRRHRAILGLLGAAAVLTGCGGADPVRAPGGILRLTLDEYRIRPQSVEVRAGVIQIVARNAGRLTHNVRIEESTDAEGATPAVYGGTPTAQPGESVRSGPIRLRAGVYRLLCSIQNHRNLGQYGELHVLPAGA